jgi:glycine oxidase
MKQSYDVAIIGGGVIGAACARAAAGRGARVVLFEPGPDPAAASAASAGLLAAQIEPTDPETLASAVHARDLYESLAATLREDTGIDIGFWRDGIASVALDDAAAERLHAGVAAQRQAGLRCDWLEPEDVRERWPAVAPGCLGALYAPEDGAVDAPALIRALLADARRLGVTIASERVERVANDGRAVTGVAAGGAVVACVHVVVAAGAWSSRLAGLPRPLPVEPVRGQMIQKPWPPGMPRAVLYADHAYAVERGGKAILGSTMERAGFDCRVTNEGLAEIQQRVTRLLPALGALPVERAWAGLRPVTPDGLPIVGPDEGVEGLLYATGHGRNGILFAALTGEAIGDLVTKGRTDLDISTFAPQRLFPG